MVQGIDARKRAAKPGRSFAKPLEGFQIADAIVTFMAKRIEMGGQAEKTFPWL
jgi:hypothetical protein